jgi:hypothetical protein
LDEKVSVFSWNFNLKTLRYWVESEYFWAYDQKSLIKQGDWIIIKPMLHVDSPIKSIRPITHEVEKVVFPFGNRVDPVTKKLAYELKFADDIEFKRNLIVDVIEKPFEEVSFGWRSVVTIRKIWNDRNRFSA